MGVNVITSEQIVNGQTTFNAKFSVNSGFLNDALLPNLTSILRSLGSNMFSDPNEYILSLRQYPINVNTWFKEIKDETVALGKLNDIGTAPRLLKPYASRKVASFTIPKYFENIESGYKFLDYAPYTMIQLYLVFIGFVTLPTNIVMGKTINIYYAIDFDTSKLTSYITVVDGELETLLMTNESKIGIEIPIGKTNANEIGKNLLTTGLATAGGLVQASLGNEIGAGATVVGIATNTANSVFNSLQNHVSGGTIGDSFNAQASPRSFFLRIERPKIVDIYNYQKLWGKPLMQMRRLSSMQGFTRMNSVHIENIGSATSDEKNEIEQTLINGVII